MAGRIPQSFIDDLMSRVDIVDVVESRVALRKAGREYQACCPFHDEKTPSFSVSPQKQFYHCFGCGAHGTAVSFLMDYDHMGFVEAVEELASRVGMEVIRDEAQESSPAPAVDHLYQLMSSVAGSYSQQLRQKPAADEAINYLKSRGLSGEIAKEFGIGYAPAGWNNLEAQFGKQHESELIETGMLIRKESGACYDRFRERIMFPIRDQRGRVIAFGGRVLGDDTPKYLNSPETPIFHKGSELYGLYEVRQAMRKLERVLVVEGYMDVVALAQYGIRYAMATLGTATTQEHITKLFRMVPEVVCCFDGDRAGREAAWRALENALPLMREGKQLRFMFLPDGDDPDSIVRREGRDGFEVRLQQAMSFSEFFYHVLTEKVDMKSLDGRSRLVELAKPLIDKIPQGVLQHMMVSRLSELAGIEAGSLSGLLGMRRDRPRAAQRAKKTKGAPSIVRKAIYLLLNNPGLAALVEASEELLETDEAGIEVMVRLVDFLQGRPHMNCGSILEHMRQTPDGVLLNKIAGLAYPALDDGLEDEFRDLLARLQGNRAGKRLEILSSKPVDELTSEERVEFMSLLNNPR